MVASQTVAVGHVFRETAATEPRFTTLGHVGKFDARHPIGDVDALTLPTVRTDVFADQFQPAPTILIIHPHRNLLFAYADPTT